MVGVDHVLAVHTHLCGPQPAAVADELASASGDVPLPPPAALPGALADTLLQRRSRYAFGPDPLGLDTVSALLRWALGVQRTVAGGHVLRMAPAARGLPSLRVHLVVSRAGELAAGVYEYQRQHDVLSRVAAGDPPLRQVFVQPEFADRAPAMVALSGRLGVVLAKYPPRHYRTVHVDAGVAIQNLYLVATALGLSGCAVAGFHDAAMARLLRLPAGDIPLMMFPIGYRP